MTTTTTRKITRAKKVQSDHGTVTIAKKGEGWFYVTPDRYGIPAEICALSASTSKWMQSIQFPCQDCDTLHTARVLHSESSVPGSCPECAESFWCPDCGGHPDDCDCD